MNAFLARRLSLKDAGHGNLVVLGSRYSANTLTLREFLTAMDTRLNISILTPRDDAGKSERRTWTGPPVSSTG